MLTMLLFCKILFVIYVFFKPLSAYIENYSANSTNEEWCYFKSLSETTKMTYCKFNCWANPSKHLPVNNQVLRNSLVSLNVQISNKRCNGDVNFRNFQNMKSLVNVLINGHVKKFNLTSLLLEAPGLKQLMISSIDLVHLTVDGIPQSQLKSIYLIGGFDPKQWKFIESCRKTLKTLHLALKFRISIPKYLFSNMLEIEFIALQIVSDQISYNSFSNLPKLCSLLLKNNYNGQTKFEKNILNNLPALNILKIIDFDIEYKNNNEMFCSNISKNVHHFVLDTSSVVFIERCMDVWSCVDCGVEGSTITQTMEFRSLITSFRHQDQMRLDDILPNPNRFHYLNTTRLILIDTHITIITSTSLSRLPLLTHYHHHRSWRYDEIHKPFISIGDIDRFEDNPFERFFTNRSRLIEVKLSISICDCISYKVYNYLISRNVSVYFYCQNLASEIESIKTDTWIPRYFFSFIMQLRCTSVLISLQLELLLSCLCLLFFRLY